MTLAHLPTGMIIYLRKKVPAVNHRVVTLDDAITRGEGVQKRANDYFCTNCIPCEQLRHRYFWTLEMIWIFSHRNVVAFFVAGSFSNCYYVCTSNDVPIWTRLVIDKTPWSKSWHHFQFITSTIQHIQGIVIRSDVNNMFLLTALFLVLKSNMLDEICNGFSSALQIFCAWMNNDNVDHSHNFHCGDISQMGICSKCFSLPAFNWGKY